MSKKISDITKSLDISFQELKKYAIKLGIELSSARGSVESSDAERLESTVRMMKGDFNSNSGSNRPKIKAVPIIGKTHAAKPADNNEDAEKDSKAESKEVSEDNSKEDAKTAEISSDKPVDTEKAEKKEKTDKEVKIEKTENKSSDKAGKTDSKAETKEKESAAARKTDKADKVEKAEKKADKADSEDKKKADNKEKSSKTGSKEPYVNAPNRPMRFKKIIDVNDIKEEPKAKPVRKVRNEDKSDKTDNKERRGSRDRNDRGDKNNSRNGGKSDNRNDNKRQGDRPNKDRASFSKDKPRDDNHKPHSKPSQKSGGSDSAPVDTKTKGKRKKIFENNDKNKENQSRNNDGPGKNAPRRGFEDRSLEKHVRGKHKNKPKEEVEQPIEELLPEGTIAVKVPITVAGLSEQAEISSSMIIMTMMKNGVMVTLNQILDKDTVEMLGLDLGINIVVTEEEEEVVEEGIDTREDNEKELLPRPPIITVMGHVDHGKTSLLDAIRTTNVTAGESGGITQHIGASEVTINGKKIVFLDTPGHEAFTTMRARGAQITDIAVLVVAADDSVKPQTIESISHAKAAGVPIIVAINKIDKPGANLDKVKKDLSEHGVLVEDWGGDVISVPVSAKKGTGITDLLEMILLQAEVLELKANPNRLASGTVIEARLDKAKGPIATLLVTNGTLKTGQSVVAGTCSGKIRVMTNYKGDVIRKATPATAVEILGLSDVPMSGDAFNVVKDDKVAREIASNRLEKLREDVLAKNASRTLEKLFSEIQEGEFKELNLIVKGDVQGSVGAIIQSLEKLDTPEVKIRVIHSGVGTVNESDVTLAETSNAIIIGFNVRPTTAVMNQANDAEVEIRLYRVIYNIIDDIQDAMKGMLDPEFKEVVLGKAEVRDLFKVPNIGVVAGTYVTEGKMQRNAQIRLVRDGIVVHEGLISSLKRFKDDAKEVAAGYECGLGIEKYNDLKPGDVIECFTMVEVER